MVADGVGELPSVVWCPSSNPRTGNGYTEGISSCGCEQLVAAGLIWGTYNPTNQNNFIHTVTHRLESPIS